MDGRLDSWMGGRAGGHMNRRVEGRTDQIDGRIDRPTHRRTDGRMGGQVDGRADRWTDRQTGGRNDRQMDGWADRWTDGWTGGRTDRHMDGSTDGQMDRRTDRMWTDRDEVFARHPAGACGTQVGCVAVGCGAGGGDAAVSAISRADVVQT